ncbi:tryptophan synthase subunit alpha [Microbacterium sp. YY-01]|uniref:tryptophan synthase subunit alpha n=1 Tax=Microbacterium sp. YY-01 TaxID=3421634 RepID=UPI003D16AF9F
MREEHHPRASLEVLRAEAEDERDVLILERLRGGEDPWEFMDDLPSIDELVVLLLRADHLAEYPQTLSTRDAEFTLLRGIALSYPELTPAVWRLLGSDEAYRSWSLTSREE